MAKEERSSGVVLYHGLPRHYLLLHYPSGHWDFPKGHVEKSETDLQAALREVEEETGIRDVEIHQGFQHAFDYHYKRDKALCHKTVTYFVGRVASRDVRLSHEHQGFVWLPYTEALARITYSNAKELLVKADAFLAKSETSPHKRWF